MSEVIFNEQIVSPGTPATDKVKVYAKSDGRMYQKDDAGTETPMGAGNSFQTIDCPSGTDPVADSSADTLVLATDGNIDITGNSVTDTVTFSLNTVPIAKGGTGQTTALAAFEALSPITTRGDLVTRDATNEIRLPIGAAGRVLRSDGTDPSWSQVALATDVSGTLPIANGGTGQTTAINAFNSLSPITTRGDLITNDATNDVRLAIGAANRVLRSNGTDPSWSQVALATDVSGTLPIANGGTGQTTATAAFNALDPLTTKGDLIANDGTNSVRLPVSAVTGDILTVDPAEATGIKWVTPTANSPLFVPSSYMQLYDDFASGTEDTDEFGNYSWRTDLTGTGSTFTRFTGVSGHPGIARLSGGTVATGRSCVHLGDTGLHFGVLGGGVIVCEVVARVTGTLSLSGTTQFGLGTSFTATTDNTDGVYFEVATADTNWFLVVRSGSVSTRRDTGIAYSSGTWVRFRYTVNAGATSIQANINGSDVGAAITTNIPTAGISPFFKQVGAASGTALNLDADYFYLSQQFTSAR